MIEMIKSANFLLIIILIMQNIISLFTLGENLSYISEVLINQLFTLCIPLIIYLVYSKRRLSFKNTQLSFQKIIICAAGTISLGILAQFVNIPVLSLMENYGKYNNEIYIPNGSFEFTAFFILIAITPAIIEEIIFRKIVLKEYRGAYNDIIAIILCGFAFAILHGNFALFLPQFLIGTYLAYITIKSGEIYLAVICHFIHNSSSLIAQKFFYNELSNLIYGNMTVVFIISVLILWLSIIFLRKEKTTYKRNKIEIPVRSTKISLWLFITIALFFKIIFI